MLIFFKVFLRKAIHFMERIKERKEKAWNSLFYSIQRIDLLIVSFCGGGIYICLETMKFYNENDIPQEYIIKFAGIFFLIGMILNFLSQYFGYKSNEYDYLMCETDLDALNKKMKKCERKKFKLESIKYDLLSESYTKKTNFLNFLSMFTMLLALVLLCIFFIIF